MAPGSEYAIIPQFLTLHNVNYGCLQQDSFCEHEAESVIIGH
jgi:hypothetical protein